ncbi:hypothetical protein TNCV_4696571 [Trichonephila clavipes]|nr:hypothetical protein TNCV_4696571 [Trichonephila clavipes]
MPRTDENISIYEKKILKFIFGGIQDKATGRRRSNFKLYQSSKESDIVNSSKYNELNGQVILSEWTKTAPLKMSSIPNQLAHDERAGQNLDGLMA